MNSVSNPPSAQSATANLAEAARSTAESVRKTAEDVASKVRKPCLRPARPQQKWQIQLRGR